MDNIQKNLDFTCHDILDEFIVGVDEVGRGPLVGDVVAAAVILPKQCQLLLKDSKKLSESKRERLAVQIKQEAVDFCVAMASPEEIDSLNILHATMLAMKRAVEGLNHPIKKVLVDGNRCPNVSYDCEAIVKGDGKVPVISAASILAKVHRDQQMQELHDAYPDYGFDAHKGYPTKAHLENLSRYGLIPGYRQSFKPVKNILNC
ncbi:ribonuclease HII [Hydrogenovibrio sp. 3SP14C1]|uniref:ribonuclease HII n=1 Tax=Hydrogenovibrio sp. 3SP14C1 TaxID=3038774 RepID=UPI00241659BE|nr:ribonuclease HII [Hydrogenovibrio sp. 3SP14C1]MDG4812833.1 ribonuclease HII [Hydrogenovibrio sp. 3SP14C1]